MNVLNLSYTTSPISEYLGSHIYKLLEFEAHDTILGISDKKLVVACKDFLNKNEIILDYNSIKNDYDEQTERELENLSSSSSNYGTDIDEVLILMANNNYFKRVPELKIRFWDMFIVDAFINNNDRNYNNWGLVLNMDKMELSLSPVYDNGASFYSKTSDDKIRTLINDDFKLKQIIYDSCVSSFSKDGRIINPLKYIESMQNKDCNEALLRVFPKIDMKRIKELFDSIPLMHNDILVLTELQRNLYYKSLLYKYENVLKPIYNKLLKNNN